MDLSAEVARRLANGEKALQQALSTDPHRPQYHFLPPAAWMNDPNGLIQWRGRYHLFYQYNPDGPFWGPPHWGHAVSDDLVHWTDLPVAMAPTPGSVDEDGCFSGCAVDYDGIPTFIYTGVRGEEQLPCVATSTDDLLTWQKHAGNPVISAPPEDLDIVIFRDHSAWKEGDTSGVWPRKATEPEPLHETKPPTWYQVIGASIRDVGGAALLYRSKDLLHWEYLHPLCVGDKDQTEPIWTGLMWECPDFFALDGRHVLIVSVHDGERPHYVAYLSGAYTDHRFTPETQGIVDFGGHFYAPQTLLDDRGRRIMWGWLREGHSSYPPTPPQAGGYQQWAAGWAGVMSLPRILSILPDGSLGMEPAPELATLRHEHHRFTDMDLTPESSNPLEGVRGDCLEIVAIFEPGDAEGFGVKVRCSPDNEEQTVIAYDRVRQRLGLVVSDPYVRPGQAPGPAPTRSKALYTDFTTGMRWSTLELADGEPLELHVFVDRSVVEVFANGRGCTTARIYPSRADSLGVDLFAQGGAVRLKSLDVWEMGSIWTG